MAELFLSYARADQRQAARVAAAIEEDGRSLWWDRRLASGMDYAAVIEGEIAAARCVLVAWSAAARDSLWVRAEANEALDQGKLVQVNFDGAKPPLPFAMLHWNDLRAWNGERAQAPWPELRTQIDTLVSGHGDGAARRPDPGGVPLIERGEPALQGFGTVAMLGWAALVTSVILALSVLMVVRSLISAEAFAVISITAAAVAALLLAACAYLMFRIARASRR